MEASNHVFDQNWRTPKNKCIGFTLVSTDYWDYQQTMHQYLHAKLNVFTQSATENTVVMINKEPNSLLPK